MNLMMLCKIKHIPIKKDKGTNYIAVYLLTRLTNVNNKASNALYNHSPLLFCTKKCKYNKALSK